MEFCQYLALLCMAVGLLLLWAAASWHGVERLMRRLKVCWDAHLAPLNDPPPDETDWP